MAVNARGRVITGSGVSERKLTIDVSFNSDWEFKGKTWVSKMSNLATDINTSKNSAAMVDSAFYVMGGRLSSGYLSNTNLQYEIKTPQTSAVKREIPAYGDGFGGINVVAISVDKDIYLIGMFGKTSDTYNLNYCYHTLTNTWEIKLARPTTSVVNGASVGTDIYMFGGGLTYCYHTLTNTWEAKATTPFTKNNSVIVSYGSDIYIFGGYDGSYSYDTYCYHALTNTWEVKAAMPAALYNSVALVGCSLGDNIHIMGLNKHSIYNIQNDSWDIDVAPTINFIRTSSMDSVIYGLCRGSSNSSSLFAYSLTDRSKPYIVEGRSTMLFDTKVELNGIIIESNTVIDAPPNSKVVFLGSTKGEILEKVDEAIIINKL